MTERKHVQIDGKMHRIAFFSPGRYTTASGSPPGPIDVSTIPYSMIEIVNIDPANTCYVGANTSTSSSSGIPLAPGGSLVIASNDPEERVRLCDLFVSGDGANAVGVAYWGVG